MLSVVTEFLSHMETFRQYSHFCASRHRLGQLLGELTPPQCFFLSFFSYPPYSLLLSLLALSAAVSPPDQLQLFMDARNPKGDPALMLEALLIRPIVVRLMDINSHSVWCVYTSCTII